MGREILIDGFSEVRGNPDGSEGGEGQEVDLLQFAEGALGRPARIARGGPGAQDRKEVAVGAGRAAFRFPDAGPGLQDVEIRSRRQAQRGRQVERLSDGGSRSRGGGGSPGARRLRGQAGLRDRATDDQEQGGRRESKGGLHGLASAFWTGVPSARICPSGTITDSSPVSPEQASHHSPSDVPIFTACFFAAPPLWTNT